MNFRDLEYVVAVSELGSFSRAAAGCNVSQPSLSTQVKKLEEELGVEIFLRGGKRITLTPVGEEIVAKAREILALQSELANVSREKDCPLAGKIRLGAILTVAPYIFSTLIASARSEAPGLRFLLKEAKTADLIADLIRGKLDAALVSLPTDDNVFESRLLFSDPFYVAVPAKHLLARRSVISESDLAGERLILLDEGHCFRDQALRVCSSLEARENSTFRATSFETIRHLVAAGEGVTLMPEVARRRGDGLKYLPVQEEGFSREIGIIWRKNSKESAFLEKLTAFIQSALQK